MYGSRSQAVRVKVKKNEKGVAEEWRKFSVDPQITSLEVLYSILAKAFEIKCDFGISYKTINPNTKTEEQLIIFSDWDLDAAFLRAHNTSIPTNSEPTLLLQIDVKPFSEQPDWESNSSSSSTLTTMNSNLQQSIGAGQKYVQTKLPGLIMNQMEKTFSIVSRALNFVDDPSLNQIQRPPLSDNEFRYYCDSVGQIIHQMELRKVIFSGGIDPSLRRVVWKHILNVYPSGLTGKERMDYIKRKSAEYYKMREVWRTAVMDQGSSVSGELAYVTSMVRKDVLRTDRHHPFYAGNDDNQNIGALFNVLTTYALNHPSVNYCQGMSDIASPILVTMCDEAQSYICFCGLMSRMKFNFMIDGIAMTKKFAHLSEALQYYDIDFYNYLKHHQADDLLFCYRWLLLEMKREFAFEDSMRMLEIMWASLPIDQPEKELKLFEKEFEIAEVEVPAPKSPTLLRTENPYTKICALRRQNSAVSISSHQAGPNQSKLDVTKRLNQSLDETASEEYRKSIKKAHQSLDETKLLMLQRMNSNTNGDAPSDVTNECKTDSSIEDISEEKNPFLYSDSTDADLPTGSDNSTEMKTITRGNSLTETLKDLKEKLAASKIGIINTIEKLEEDFDPLTASLPEVKLVKNFSEFLNFAKKSNSEDKADEEADQLTVDSNLENKVVPDASPDDSQDYYPMTTSVTRGLKIELDNLNRQVFGQNYQQFKEEDAANDLSPAQEKTKQLPYIKLEHQMSSIDAIEVDTGQETGPVKLRKTKRETNDELTVNRFSVASSINNDVFIWQNPLHASSDCLQSNIQPSPNQATTPDEQADIEYDGEIITMQHGKKSVTPIRLVRKNCDTQRSNRNSTIEPDSDSEESDRKWNVRLNSNNPFFDQIQQLSASQSEGPEETNEQAMMNSCEEASEITPTVVDRQIITMQKSEIAPPPEMSASSNRLELPSPADFGNGNPFLMFLCLTLLLQHRDYIMRTGMDYNEMAMHFDKMVRKHNVIKVLSQARRLYQDYLRYHNEKSKNSNNTKT